MKIISISESVPAGTPTPLSSRTKRLDESVTAHVMQPELNPFNRRHLLCFLSTLFFWCCAHGYRFLNTSFSGDSTLIFQAGEEIPYQISLGRFLQPVWWQIRGAIVAPYLIGLFCLIFLSFSGMLVTRILRINKPLPVFLVCGILTANETLGIANATYIPWSDVYCVSLFFALLSAYVSLSDKRIRWLSPIPLAISLGLYQSYIASAASIIVLVLLKNALTEPDSIPKVWLRGIGCILRIFLGLLLYAVLLKVVLSVVSVRASDEYNGVGLVAYSDYLKLPGLIWDAWLLPIRILLNPEDRSLLAWHTSLIPQWINWITVLLILCQLFFLFHHTPASIATACFLLGIFPFSVNFVMVIARGTVNGLMLYAWCFFYLIPVVLAESEHYWPSFSSVFRFSSAAAIGILLFVNVISCNQMAIKRDLELSATHSAFTRILGRAEQTEEYEPGVTPVVLMGMLPSSSISMIRPGMEDISNAQGMKYTYGAAYETSEYWYLTEILGAKVNLVSQKERKQLDQEMTNVLPHFPSEGCFAMIDGRLYIQF